MIKKYVKPLKSVSIKTRVKVNPLYEGQATEFICSDEEEFRFYLSRGWYTQLTQAEYGRIIEKEQLAIAAKINAIIETETEEVTPEVVVPEEVTPEVEPKKQTGRKKNFVPVITDEEPVAPTVTDIVKDKKEVSPEDYFEALRNK